MRLTVRFQNWFQIDFKIRNKFEFLALFAVSQQWLKGMAPQIFTYDCGREIGFIVGSFFSSSWVILVTSSNSFDISSSGILGKYKGSNKNIIHTPTIIQWKRLMWTTKLYLPYCEIIFPIIPWSNSIIFRLRIKFCNILNFFCSRPWKHLCSPNTSCNIFCFILWEALANFWWSNFCRWATNFPGLHFVIFSDRIGIGIMCPPPILICLFIVPMEAYPITWKCLQM